MGDRLPFAATAAPAGLKRWPLAGLTQKVSNPKEEHGSMVVQEPTVTYPEEHFQSAIVAVLREILKASGHQFILIESFGLDIAVFIATKSSTIVCFIEVKAFGAQRMGGVGFGNGR